MTSRTPTVYAFKVINKISNKFKLGIFEHCGLNDTVLFLNFVVRQVW